MSVPLRERLYQTEAIVLRRLDLNEADRILTVYTPARGKYSVIAKGVRRPSSRMGAHVELLSRTTLSLAKGRDLDVVSGAQLLQSHQRLHTDLDAFSHACYFVELLLRMTEERQENRAIYDLLTNSLQVLDDGIDPFSVTRHFELVLLSLLGYKPELYRCLGCSNELVAERNALSNRMGGMLCPRCVGSYAGAFPLSVNAQKYLRALDRAGLASVVRLPLDAGMRNELEGALTGYIRFHSERDLQSLKVWHALEQLPTVN